MVVLEKIDLAEQRDAISQEPVATPESVVIHKIWE